jgi:pimeloyl-ACP methyl ester carboxylesterase
MHHIRAFFEPRSEPEKRAEHKRSAWLRLPAPRTGMSLESFFSLGPHGFHRIAYTAWGDRASPRRVLCMHGLTRNARDFDWLAHALQRDSHVVCMDAAGRGASEWLEHKPDYTFRLYQADAAALIARISAPASGGRGSAWFSANPVAGDATVDWVGTSMGGLIGMLLAAQPRSPIRRLVLNDVGPFVSWSALMRFKSNPMMRSTYPTLEQAEAVLRQSFAGWGPLNQEQWVHLAQHSILRTEDGEYTFACDPRIADATAWGFSPEARVGTRNLLGLELWSVWANIRCPVLILRGKESQVLLPETVEHMQRRDARTEVVEFDGVGHAPALMAPDQIDVVRRFLSSPD